MNYPKKLQKWMADIRRNATRTNNESKRNETLSNDLFRKYPREENVFEFSFQQFADKKGQEQFQHVSWEEIKARMDFLFYCQRDTSRTDNIASEQQELINHINTELENTPEDLRGPLIAQKRTLIKMLLESGEYSDVEKLRPFPEDISDERDIKRLVQIVRKGHNTPLENFYIVHAIIGSRGYGMIPFELMAELMSHTNVEPTTPFLKSLEALYSKKRQETPLTLANRLRWLMYMEKIFPDKIPYTDVSVNEEFQYIKNEEKRGAKTSKYKTLKNFNTLPKNSSNPYRCLCWENCLTADRAAFIILVTLLNTFPVKIMQATRAHHTPV